MAVSAKDRKQFDKFARLWDMPIEPIEMVEKAKMIRETLKRNHPDFSFSVRIVRARNSVAVLVPEGFDPRQLYYLRKWYSSVVSLDSAQGRRWLMPDGSVQRVITEGENGFQIIDGARLVRFKGGMAIIKNKDDYIPDHYDNYD